MRAVGNSESPIKSGQVSMGSENRKKPYSGLRTRHSALGTVTIAEAINKAAARLSAHGVQNARLDAEVLLCHVLSKDRSWLLAHIQDTLDDHALRFYHRTVDRRAVREPLQYITGSQEFWGLKFTVTQDVLIPRPETELVVESAIKAAHGTASPLIVDLCTGSGCIAVSIAKELAGSRIFATDNSEKALAVARANADRHGVTDHVRFLEGDLFDPLQELDIRGRIDIIAANPPYVPSAELGVLQPEVRDFEPEIALTAGPSGTEIVERIINAAPEYLRKGGILIMEIGLGQSAAIVPMIKNAGAYATAEVLKDLAGIDRVIVARKK